MITAVLTMISKTWAAYLAIFQWHWRMAHACCFVDQLAWIARGRPRRKLCVLPNYHEDEVDTLKKSWPLSFARETSAHWIGDGGPRGSEDSGQSRASHGFLCCRVVQLDLLRNWRETTAYKNHVQLLPKQLDVQASLLTPLRFEQIILKGLSRVQERRLLVELDEKVANHFPALRAKLNVFAQEHADSVVVKVEGPFRNEHYRLPAVKFSRESEVDGSMCQEQAEGASLDTRGLLLLPSLDMQLVTYPGPGCDCSSLTGPPARPLGPITVHAVGAPP